MCYQKEIIKNCKCFSPSFHNLNATIPCIDFFQYTCTIQTYRNIVEIIQNCIECPNECDTIVYELSTSFGKYPTRDYSEYLVRNSFLRTIFSDVQANYSAIRKSVAAVNVFYSELKYTEIRQQPKATLVDLICGVGGILGLFVGASFLSIVELLEASIAVVLAKCSQYRYKIESTNKINNP